ncbi:MAG: DUF4127 family protein [bacterium]
MKILFIPLDDRPCCLNFPRELAHIVGWELLMPPREALGCFLTPGSPPELGFWIKNNFSEDATLVVSLDMLAYGGLVASRLPLIQIEDALENLGVLPSFRSQGAKTSIYAFQSLMRAAPTATTPGEDGLARKIEKYSFLKEAVNREHSPEKMAELRDITRRIPEGDLQDYLMTRERNHLLNTRMIYWVKDGFLDYLVIGLDDVPSGGLSIAERRILEALVDFQRLGSRVVFHPGTDEMGLLLLARAISSARKVTTAIFPIYSRPETSTLIPRYEDESLERILEKQIEAAGAKMAGSMKEADILLFVHTPDGAQEEAVFQPLEEKADGALESFISAIVSAILEGREVALADTAYANGADRLLVIRLRRTVPIHLLASFAAWNTAANTLGTAIAQSILRFIGKDSLKTEDLSLDEARRMEEAHLSFLFSRFLDDWAYQSIIREKIKKAVVSAGLSPLFLGEGADWVAGMVRDCLRESGKQFFEEHFQGQTVRMNLGGKEHQAVIGPLTSIEASLPWNRLFEVDITPFFELRT